MPPLRAHREDIALLAEAFLQQAVAANQLEARRFTPAALRALEQAAWPGNVRQLAHVVERAVMLSRGPEITVEELGLEAEPQPVLPGPAGGAVGPEAGMGFNLEAMTEHLLRQALAHTRGHKGQAAALLGVHPRTLTRMLRRSGLPED
jgi:DNA-binding NtrC family response regulator